MVCCLIAPSHYLHQFWLLSKVLSHSPESNFTVIAQATTTALIWKFYNAVCTATSTFDKWHDIHCLRAEFTAKHGKAPLSLTTRWWMEPDLGSWQSPDISRSHLYHGTIAWTPPTAIYRAYTVFCIMSFQDCTFEVTVISHRNQWVNP